MKVLFHYAAGPDLMGRLAALPGLDIAICPEGQDERLTELLAETEVLWHVLQPCTAALIASAPRLRLIQKIGVGVNTIDLQAAATRGIPVCNLPGTNARAVAELTLALMLATIRRLLRFDSGLRQGIWSDPLLQDGLGELGGRTVGLVGYGAVPRILAPVLRAMGCDVIYTSHEPKPGAVGEWVPFDVLLAEADVVSLHVPLTDETVEMLDAAALARMKEGAVLINTARGGLVNQAALINALRSGRLGGAGLDVFATEPLASDEPLCSLANVVLTPHVAWLTRGTFERSFAIAVENCRRLLAHEGLLHRVI